MTTSAAMLGVAAQGDASAVADGGTRITDLPAGTRHAHVAGTTDLAAGAAVLRITEWIDTGVLARGLARRTGAGTGAWVAL